MMRKALVHRARELTRDEGGQAVIEYILILTILVTATGTLAFGLRKTLFRLWQVFSQEITAGCPGCPPDPQIRLPGK